MWTTLNSNPHESFTHTNEIKQCVQRAEYTPKLVNLVALVIMFLEPPLGTLNVVIRLGLSHNQLEACFYEPFITLFNC